MRGLAVLLSHWKSIHLCGESLGELLDVGGLLAGLGIVQQVHAHPKRCLNIACEDTGLSDLMGDIILWDYQIAPARCQPNIDCKCSRARAGEV